MGGFRVRLGLPPRGGPRGWTVSVGRAEEPQRVGWGLRGGMETARWDGECLRGQGRFLELTLRVGFYCEIQHQRGYPFLSCEVCFGRGSLGASRVLGSGPQAPFLVPGPRTIGVRLINPGLLKSCGSSPLIHLSGEVFL